MIVEPRLRSFRKRPAGDFAKAKDRKKFLRKLHEELPDEILMSPPSKLWAPSLEAKVMDHAGNQNELFKKRREDHDVILTFAALVYEVQRRGGRHAHLEHPWTSRAWLTKAFKAPGRLRDQGGPMPIWTVRPRRQWHSQTCAADNMLYDNQGDSTRGAREDLPREAQTRGGTRGNDRGPQGVPPKACGQTRRAHGERVCR